MTRPLFQPVQATGRYLTDASGASVARRPPFAGLNLALNLPRNSALQVYEGSGLRGPDGFAPFTVQTNLMVRVGISDLLADQFTIARRAESYRIDRAA